MKFFVCVLAVALLAGVQALTDEQKEKIKDHSRVCQGETGVDRELIKRVKGGDFGFEDAKIKDFFLCMLKRAEVMSEDGQLQKDVILRKVEPAIRDDVSRAVDACSNEGGATNSERAWNYLKCYHKERPNHDTI